MAAVILDDVMAAYPNLDLTGHESYDPKAILYSDKNMMKLVIGATSFPLLDSLRSSDQRMTFEKILASPMDEDVDYLQFKD